MRNERPVQPTVSPSLETRGRTRETKGLPTDGLTLDGKHQGEDGKRKICPTDRPALLIRWKPERVDGKRKACPANRLAFVGNPRENSGNERTANRPYVRMKVSVDRKYTLLDSGYVNKPA